MNTKIELPFAPFIGLEINPSYMHSVMVNRVKYGLNLGVEGWSFFLETRPTLITSTEEWWSKAENRESIDSKMIEFLRSPWKETSPSIYAESKSKYSLSQKIKEALLDDTDE